MDNPPSEIAAGMQDGAVRILRKHLPQVIDDECSVQLLKNPLEKIAGNFRKELPNICWKDLSFL